MEERIDYLLIQLSWLVNVLDGLSSSGFLYVVYNPEAKTPYSIDLLTEEVYGEGTLINGGFYYKIGFYDNDKRQVDHMTSEEFADQFKDRIRHLVEDVIVPVQD